MGRTGAGGVGGHSWRCGWQSCGIARRAREQKGLVRRGSIAGHSNSSLIGRLGGGVTGRRDCFVSACIFRALSPGCLFLPARLVRPLTNGKSGQSSHAHQPARFAGIVFPFAFFSLSLRRFEITQRTPQKYNPGRGPRLAWGGRRANQNDSEAQRLLGASTQRPFRPGHQ